MSKEPLVIDEQIDLPVLHALDTPPKRDRVGLWRDAKAFEVHNALRQVRAAAHAVDVCLGTLMRRMRDGRGYRAWGTVSFSSYVTEDLRQKSVRRFQYLMAIDRAIVEGPLPKLGAAWRRGDVSVAQARELIRVMTPANEEEWLEAAATSSVWGLQRLVKRETAWSAESVETQDDDSPWHRRVFAATRLVDDAWQVSLETSRRMAGYDIPVHECVDDLLAEYASGAPVTAVQVPLPEADPDSEVWRRTVRHPLEAIEDLALLRRVVREARLAADPLDGLTVSEPHDAVDLNTRIRWVLRVGQNIAWHECRLLRLMADLRLYHRLGISSMSRYASEALGTGDRAAWSAIALARALDELPKVEQAFRSGHITALEASEICRVARPGTQQAWIGRASSSTVRELKEDVAFVLSVDEPSGLPPARPGRRGDIPVAEPVATAAWIGARAPVPVSVPELRTCAHETSSAVVVPMASRADAWCSAFGSDPSRIASEMLADSGRKRPVMFSAPATTALQWDLTLAHCRSQAGALSDSQCVALVLLEFLGQWAHPEVIKSSLEYRIFVRDGWRCQVPRCRSRAHLHAHHVVYRSRNGPDAPWNLVTVCETHHRMIHAGVIRARGRAPAGLEWAMGVNAAGDARERFRNGIRIDCQPLWRATSEGVVKGTSPPA